MLGMARRCAVDAPVPTGTRKGFAGTRRLPPLQRAILDSLLLRDLAPNLGAHSIGLRALFHLFRAPTSCPG